MSHLNIALLDAIIRLVLETPAVLAILAGIMTLRYAERSETVDQEAVGGQEERGVRVGL
jgi:hypothetical protein